MPARSPADAGRAAAYQHGYILPPDVAAAVAAAVLAWSSDCVTVTAPNVDAARWDTDEAYQQWVRADLSRRLALGLAERGVLPVARPRFTISARDGALPRCAALMVPVRQP